MITDKSYKFPNGNSYQLESTSVSIGISTSDISNMEPLEVNCHTNIADASFIIYNGYVSDQTDYDYSMYYNGTDRYMQEPFVGSYNVDATSADVVEGKTFVDSNKTIQTGTMQVLTYPYPYSEYHNYDYEFYEATAKSNVVRDGVSYVLASYQVVPSGKPDTWALTGNRKMKLGIPYSELASKIGLTADKIKAGVTILGITGTYTGD